MPIQNAMNALSKDWSSVASAIARELNNADDIPNATTIGLLNTRFDKLETAIMEQAKSIESLAKLHTDTAAKLDNFPRTPEPAPSQPVSSNPPSQRSNLQPYKDALETIARRAPPPNYGPEFKPASEFQKLQTRNELAARRFIADKTDNTALDELLGMDEQQLLDRAMDRRVASA